MTLKHITTRKMKRRKAVTVIKNSCVTSRAIWIHRGTSAWAAYKAYLKSCKKEMERMARWAETEARYVANITRLINVCVAKLPIDHQMTPEQTKALKALHKARKKGVGCNRDFYDHIVKEREMRNGK